MRAAGVESALASEGFQKRLATPAKFWNCSFANTLLIMPQRLDATLINVQ
jgi:hypothetical protein